jgi:hypothetical protein
LNLGEWRVRCDLFKICEKCGKKEEIGSSLCYITTLEGPEIFSCTIEEGKDLNFKEANFKFTLEDLET